VDIPSAPHSLYKDAGWLGYGDWLGTGRVRSADCRGFTEARAFIHALGLKSLVEWKEYFNSGKKPLDIPSYPGRVYKNEGWAGYGDWLGTGRVRNGMQHYRPFIEARFFVHRLKLKSVQEWKEYCKAGGKPPDIPSCPNKIYKSDGWAGYEDWLS
jgi:hypothetical protein